MKFKQILLKFLPVILVINFFFILFYYFNNYFEDSVLQEYLIQIEPVFLGINFILIIISLLFGFKEIRKVLKDVKNISWIILIIIFAIGFILRMFVAPQTHRVFFDEDIYLDIGKEILTEGKGCLCNYGDSKECYNCILMKWPNGYPFTVAVAFMFFGISESVAFNLEVLLGSISVLLVFGIGYLLSKKEEIGLFSALLFALIPVHIMWSGTTASEPIFIFYTLLSMFGFLVSFKEFNLKTSLFAMSSLAFALQVRAEGPFLFLIAVAMILLLDEKLKMKINSYKFLIPLIILLSLIMPTLLHVRHSSETDPWGSSGKVFGWEFAKENIPINAWFWFTGYPAIENPIFFTIFAIVGLIYLLKKNLKVAITLGVWFLVIFFLYAFFYAGSVKYGTDVRYAISGYPAFVIFSAYGFYLVQELVSKKFKHPWVIFLILSIIIFASFLYYVPSISTPAEEIMEANQARTYHDFVVEEAEKLDDNCYILTHTPSIFLIMNKGSLQTWYGSNIKVMREIFNRTDCVIFDDNFWCNLDPYKTSVCKHMFDNYELTEISSVKSKDGSHTYTLYRLSNPY